MCVFFLSSPSPVAFELTSCACAQVIIEDAADEKPAKTQVNDAEAEDEKPELEEGEEEVKTKKKTVKKEKVVEKKRKAPSTPVEKAKGGKKAKGEPKAKEEPRKVTISVQQVRFSLSCSPPCLSLDDTDAGRRLST